MPERDALLVQELGVRVSLQSGALGHVPSASSVLLSHYGFSLDRDIRNSLRHMVLQAHADDSATVIVEELGILQGSSFVDVAVVNGTCSAYEIKSVHDSLVRLPGQVESYSKVRPDYSRDCTNCLRRYGTKRGRVGY